MRHTLLVGIVIVSLLLAGCASITWDDTEPTTTTAPNGTSGPDPAEDVIGWEDGYWHNESITVDQSDGLNDTELDAYVARGMARVEYLRNREFLEDVPVTVISREEYQRGGGSADPAYRAWNNQVWEGLFIVGEDADVQDAFAATRGSAVAGFYAPSTGAITIITPTPSEPRIDNVTLIHELVHALQDQYVDLGASRFGGRTQDGQLAADGLIEGEANYIEDRYTTRCGSAWRCVEGTRGGGGGDIPASFNFGLFMTIFHPYSDGPVWVAHQLETMDWARFDRFYKLVPTSSEQIIHTTNESPIPLEYTHTAVNGWEPFLGQGIDGADTVGEASIFAMFWYQSRNYNADILEWRTITNVDSPYDTYNYSSDPSAGWGNDLLVPYQRGSGEDAQYGYVWKTVWDTERDATQFRTAYEEILQTQNGSQVTPGTWVLASGPFADAFRVTQNGTHVTIVNAPTVEALDGIRPTNRTPTTTTTTATTGADGTGFGILLALTAILAAIAWRRRG